jgi:hypothetical protein
MSYIGNQGEQSTSSEITALTNLTALATSGVGEFLRKIGTNTFENATPSEVGFGTVTSVSIVSQNGISGTVVHATTTPEITLTLGAITPNTVTVTSLTASELIATNSSKMLTSLAVATYPSLTEISYVKGLSSAVQTQLNAKQATLTFGIANTNKVQIDAADVALNDYAKFTANGLLGRSYSEVLSDIGAAASAHTHEGTAILSTGEAGGAKFLREDGDGTCSWQAVPAAGAATTLNNLANVAINTTLLSDTDNTDALGTTAIAWSDLFLGNGAVITFNSAPSTADVTITHSANALAFAGGTVSFDVAPTVGVAAILYSGGALGTPISGTVTNLTGTASININGTVGATTPTTGVFTTATVNTGLMPDANDGAYLGQSGTAFSDLFLASGGVINWDAANVTLTHSAGNLALSAGTVFKLDHIAEITGSHTIVADNTITTATGAGIVLPAGGGIKLTLPTTDAQCTGNYTDSFQSGYTAAAGDLVYYGTGGKWLEVDADAVATCKGLIGIAMEAKNDTEAMKVALPGSMVHFDAWTWTTGDTLYAGETLGAIQNTIPTGADAIIRVVGFAIDADTIFFNPSSDQQSTVA